MGKKLVNTKLVTYGFIGLLASGVVTAWASSRNFKTQHEYMISSDATTQINDSHAGHSMPDMNTSGTSGNSHNEDSHTGHSLTNQKAQGMSESVQAKLIVSEAIAANKTMPLAIDIQDSTGKAIKGFDTFQEKVMHLIVVSDDLQFFSHLHPTYKQNGRFKVAARFPQSGGYTLFGDYKPTGQAEQVSVMKTKVLGTSLPAPKVELNRTKTFGNTKVNLTLSQPTIKAGEEVTIRFNLQDAANNRLLTDLQPYLGERGHLVILRQSSSLTRDNYVHAHAVKNTPTGQVEFMTSFPQPGRYKLWGQFNRNGKIVTADFWINVV